MSEKSEPSKVRGNPVIKRLLKKQNKHKILSDTRFQVLIIVIFCAVAGIAFLVVKSLTSSYSLWPNNPIPNTITSANNSSIELGVKFVSKDSGYVTGIRFYKDPQNTGIHIGSLWSSNGTLLARVNFTNETNSGWQTATLAQPVNIAANVIYVVSYHALNGDYSFNSSYFSHRQSHTNGPLTAFADNSIYGANGVYVNSATPKFPTKDMNGANFWVDLVFSTKRVAPPTAPAPPTILTATQDGTTIIVAWNTGISAKSIASYNIVRNGKQYAKVSSVTFTYIDSNVMAGHTYNYQIQTIDNTGAVSAKSFNTSITYNITPGPAVALSASPESITAGSSSNLTWFSTNATSCQAASPASWTSLTANSGNQSVSPTNTTTYAISCNGNGGITKSLPVTVKVTPAPTVSNPPQPFGNVAGSWKLVFDSEFNGSSLDTYQWSTGVDGALGITNGYDAAIEQECYDPAQVNVSEGTLNLTAIPKTEYCPPYGGTEPYASGAVTTYGHFSYTYGYAEARVWLPGTSRIADWPAFWELGQLYNVSAGEIDIVESLEGVACATFHNSGSSPSFCSSGTFAGGWHTFAADWEPGYINFYFDGANVLSVNSGITSSPMYLVLDLALSSKITSPDTAPATMKVDYVRVWQHN